ncbi:MAG: DUF3987 domain-containing protein [Rikenellaceae bacterium]
MNEKSITSQEVINAVRALGAKMDGSEFPLSAFPQKFQDIAHSASHCMGYPLDFVAGAMLFASSVAFGNTHVVKVKEGWIESAILYMAIVGKAGTNKSHPMSFAMAPLFSHDAEKLRIFKQHYAEFQQLNTLSKKEREELGHSELPTPPHLTKFIVSDITQEGVAHVHEHNKRGICLYVDELKSWINNFNRYAKGSEEQFWLSVFSGKPIIVDRRSSENSISVMKSFVSVLGSIQMSRLADLAKGERSDNGFIDRVLFVVPKFLEKRYWNTEELPKHVETRWCAMVDELINLELTLDVNGDPIPTVLPYEAAAKAKLYEWQRKNTDLCNKELDERMEGIYSKLEIYISRFALTLQMIRWACGEGDRTQIDIVSTEGAIAITEYFRETARRVQNIIANHALHSMSTAQKDIYAALPELFTTAQGIEVAVQHGVSERTFKDFVSRQCGVLFRKDKHGVYSKVAQ